MADGLLAQHRHWQECSLDPVGVVTGVDPDNHGVGRLKDPSKPLEELDSLGTEEVACRVSQQPRLHQ